MNLQWKKAFPAFCLVIILAVGGLAGEADVSSPAVLAQEAAAEPERVEACNATAPDFSICVNTAVDDQLFIDNGANCSAGCNMTLDHSFDGTKTGSYTYNVICTGGVGPPDVETGRVTVLDACNAAAPDFSICVNATVDDQ